MSDFFDSVLDFLNENAMLLLIISGSLLLLMILIILIRSIKRPPLIEDLKETYFFTNLLLLRAHNKINVRELFLILEMKIDIKRKKQTTVNCEKSLIKSLKMEQIDMIGNVFEISRVDLIFTDLRLQENRHLVKSTLDFSEILDLKKNKKANKSLEKKLPEKQKLERKLKKKGLKNPKIREELEQKKLEQEENESTK